MAPDGSYLCVASKSEARFFLSFASNRIIISLPILCPFFIFPRRIPFSTPVEGVEGGDLRESPNFADRKKRHF